MKANKRLAPFLILGLWVVVAIIELTRNLPTELYLPFELLWIVTVVIAFLWRDKLVSLGWIEKALSMFVVAYIVIASFAIAVSIMDAAVSEFGIRYSYLYMFFASFAGCVFSAIFVSPPISILFKKGYLLIAFLCSLPLNIVQLEALLSFNRTPIQIIYALEIVFRVLFIWIACIMVARTLMKYSSRRAKCTAGF